MRTKIWELPDYQCSVVGTCLSVRELEKVARQTGLELEPDATEFQIHGTFVMLCKRKGRVAKAVARLLDRKYAAAVRGFSQARDDDALRELWRQARSRGDIPGPYWALLTHPDALPALKSEAFGDVHMLSHLVGAANRADIRRLCELEEALEKMETRRARVRAAFKRGVTAIATENKALKDRLAAMAKEVEQYRNGSKAHASAALRAENEALLRSLGAQSVELMQGNMLRDSLARKAEAYERRLTLTLREGRDKDAELALLNRKMERLFAIPPDSACPPDCDKAGTDQCPGPSLCGKRILYVGGRANLVTHYRHAVERCGGEFLHHDGGVEQTRQALPRVLVGVDAVVCPVDCISHDACQCVKDICKHTMKPCVFLRSSGLSSLVRTLEELCADPATHRSA